MIEFAAGCSLYLDGTLTASGTAAHPIVFRPQIASAPWGQLILSASGAPAVFSNGTFVNGTALQHCVLERGGSGATAALSVAVAAYLNAVSVVGSASHGIILTSSATIQGGNFSSNTLNGIFVP